MARKTKSEVAVVVSPDVRTDEFPQQALELAAWLHLDLSASAAVRTERAIQAYNAATHHMVEAGLLLASVRQEVGAEAFQAVLEERGLAKQRAYELIRGAHLVARLAPEQRQQVMALHKSKVALLANASPSVVEVALSSDGDIDIDTLSVRGLRERVRELEEQAADLAVQRQTAETEAEGLRKRLKRGVPDRGDEVPHVVADLRAEVVALGHKAALALDSFNPLGAHLEDLHGAPDGIHEWADATTRLAVSQVAAIRMQADGLLAKLVKLLPGEDPVPAPRSKLTKQEMLEAAKACAELTQVHTYEAALREWTRGQGRPNGKGRPKDKPVPPGGAS